MAKIRDTFGDRVFSYVNHFLVFVLFAAVLYPLIYVLSCSISSPIEVAAGRVWLWPKGITLLGYQRVFQEPGILTGYKNTLIYTIVGTLLNLVVTVPAGYALAKRSLPGRNIIMGFFMFTMYFSGGLIPTFLLVNSLGLYNTRMVLIILGAFSMYNCIICRTFFAGIPRDIEEAAAIDGCSHTRTFIQIVLPISQALLGVMVLYFAVSHWNSYFSALIYISDESLKPLQLILRKILVQEASNAAMMEGRPTGDDYAFQQHQLRELIKYSVIVVASLPVMILYPFLQKYFVKGVMIGSVKG